MRRRGENEKEWFVRKIALLIVAGMVAGSMTGCSAGSTKQENVPVANESEQKVEAEQSEADERVSISRVWKQLPLNMPDDKYRTFYEVFVYSFYDSNDDGIGDLKGLTQKLDYINDGDLPRILIWDVMVYG